MNLSGRGYDEESKMKGTMCHFHANIIETTSSCRFSRKTSKLYNLSFCYVVDKKSKVEQLRK
uniref:Putative ovule protein n=1 Tax=Solanum chacoense TaxID=4108 RepID=A0A0V0HWK4_SOLCH